MATKGFEGTLSFEAILSKHRLNETDLESECPSDVRYKLAVKLVDWQMIGRGLQLPPEKISDIKRENDTEDQRKLALLDHWNRREGENATSLKLARVLYNRERRDLVESLCELIQASSSLRELQAYNTDLVQHPSLMCSSNSTASSDNESVSERIKRFEDRFRKLRSEIVSELLTDNDFEVDDLLNTLTSLPVKISNEHKAFIEQNLSSLEKAESVKQILYRLGLHISFIDYGLLEHIIRVHGSKKLQSRMRHYCMDIEEFLSKTTVNELIDHWPGLSENEYPPNFTLLMVRIKRDPYKCTIKDLDRYRRKFLSKAMLSEVIGYLIGVEKGNSFYVLWLLPSSVIPELVKSFDQLQSDVTAEYIEEVVISGKREFPKETTMPEESFMESSRKQVTNDALSSTITTLEHHSSCFSKTDTAFSFEEEEVTFGEVFGQRRPPLSIYIKGILERYPDGQIFKEIIQNADDAGATTIQFFLDARQHPIDTVVNKKLKLCQGPALISANNAVFSEEDWQGIQKPQQSIKADDPFKVGRFGIGFNSVYHITDIPTIISGEKIAYLDPQESVWSGQSGRLFTLDKLQDKFKDALAPFISVAGFTHGMLYYPKTLFRFPLRTVSSDLSENVYTLERIERLIDALRGEANLLLPFLRCVNAIEVYRISTEDSVTLSFKVEIATSSQHSLQLKRQSFVDKLKAAHSRQSYGISSIIDFDADFHVEVTDKSVPSRSGSTHFLVTATVGSTSPAICEAAKKQKVFPWVGTALQLDSTLSNNGRIFCFLPMPVDAVSKLPVHVNGTFGLNDDRRSMKWPGLERRNDPTAHWNDSLVSQLLPSCYVKLLLKAKDNNLLTPDKFYCAWPEASAIKGSHWEKILVPFFSQIFQHPVFWSERTETLRQVGEWVIPNNAVLTPVNDKLPSVVHRALSKCSVKVVTIPQRIWQALRTANMAVTEVSPRLVRSKFCSNINSYISIDAIGKCELLRYCLRDRQYSELQGVALLPLASGICVQFQRKTPYSYPGKLYLCNSSCPQFLLPNLEHLLVDVSDDCSLQSDLRDVATSNCTQLTLLTAQDVAQLLPQSMPSSWQRCVSVTLDGHSFPSHWFETFWNWVRNQNLNMFEGHFVLQVGTHNVIRLRKNQAVVYVPQYNSCSQTLLSALDKLGVMVSMQSHFPYLYHQSLPQFVNTFNSDGVLDSIYTASVYSRVSLSVDEAQALLSLLSQNKPYLIAKRLNVLQGIPIFTSASNSSHQLYSPTNATATSPLKKAIIEPPNVGGIVSKLPSNIILFSQSDHMQLKLLNWIGVQQPNETGFLLQHIFPLIHRKVIPDHHIDPIMDEILHINALLIVRDWNITSSLSQLKFVKTSMGYRQKPVNLFDPSYAILKKLYSGESVFPTEPYNSSQWLHFLRQSCSLRTSVNPDEILSIISGIKVTSRGYPQLVNETQLTRAKAVLQYISTSAFQRQSSGSYSMHEYRGYLPFVSALNYLANNYSWLPVLAERPSGYPSVLPWKGEGYKTHFVTLNNQSTVMTLENKESLPYIVGSQIYLTNPEDTPCSQLQANHSLCPHVIAHLELITSHCHDIPGHHLSLMMDKIYSYLNRYDELSLSGLRYLAKWIYIGKYNVFVSPSVVAVRSNSSFRHDLEPYLYVLPESLSPYQSLFTRFGVNALATQSQIIAVLGSIRESIEKNEISLNPSDVWGIVLSILNWITDNGTKEVMLSSCDQIYVPTECNSQWPQLKIANEVVYTDNDFLKNFLRTSGSDESYTFVHHRVSTQMANCLNLTPLSDFLDITEDTFEDTGQHEPLTVRLKNILREYKDGITIAKELLQNADDAEATEVNFCYDARTHTVDSNSLFFPDMLQAHGPALLVHNNKTFSDDDFENITKLAAATKQNKPLKIGKFGIGFCSVYHVTDVPSFISRDIFTIFDPTMNFLKKEIKNPSRPGKKVKFTSQLIRRSNQLAPYDGLFGFNPQQQYDGTLFRLPFRSSASELAGTCYTEDHHINNLISEMTMCSSTLILFLQNVERITFQVIREGESMPSICLEITKSILSITSPPNTNIKEITCKTTQSPESSSRAHWIVSNHSAHVGDEYATASVAASIQPMSSGLYAIDDSLEGEVFCFLPLSQKAGLPVHVSGNFAVNNNRQGIWTSDDATTLTNKEVCWNVSLMQSIIPAAYHQLLLALQTMQCSSKMQDYLFYSLWPLEEQLKQRNPWSTMVQTLYQIISSSKLFYSNNRGEWLNLSASKFLASNILCNSSSSENPEDNSIFDVLKHLNLPVVHLPMHYQKYFHLQDCTMNENDFVSLFFENLGLLGSIQQTRDCLILQMLEVFAAEYDDDTERSHIFQYYFQHYACIPCAPDGSVLRKCNELIDPNSPIAELYDVEENRFPSEELSERHLACTALVDLGMINKTLPHEEVIDRAQTIACLYETDKPKALSRVKLILETIDSHMNNDKENRGITLDSIPFLPVLPKPYGYLLSWAGDGQKLMSGKDLMVHTFSRKSPAENNGILAGSQVVFVNENLEDGCGEVSINVQGILKVRSSPTCNEVVRQLMELIEAFKSQTATEDLKKWIDRMCHQIYKFLDERKGDEDVKVVQQLTDVPCVWTGNKFLSVIQIAEQWNLNGPYLYKVPSMFSLRQNLCRILNVKDDFTISDIKSALNQMKDDFSDQPIDDCSRNVLRELVSYFLKMKPCEFDDIQILLPDEKYVLMWSTELAYNDAPWLPRDETYRYVNDIIPRRTAIQLHVRPVRAKVLERYANPKSKFHGVEFGQREELTRRIQNILKDYPFDATILKELLQNADDAKASKMCVILDKRTHGKESVLSENWQKLQGPALLVWNDSVFSEKDLKGIQELGLGSKRSETESIGQYGIGFNSVYHFTDCPSFISNGDTLCVMDPHCIYVPGAEPQNPGRRFDNLRSGFWDDFGDMKSSYLQSNIDNMPSEFLGGSLFRFPLRSTSDLLKSSKIVAELSTNVLTSDNMQQLLEKWAPKMKAAMFFLNNVRELQFFVIEKSSKLIQRQYCYCINVSLSAQEQCKILQQKISAFKEPCVVTYPLTIIDTSGEKKHQEKWIIQQGIGDIEKPNQNWTFIKQVKPRHGLAAPLDAAKTSSTSPGELGCNTFSGQVFCFLPLPIRSHFPVHINGHFILNSTRRQLWHSTNPDEEDAKTVWNKCLLSAIASSYANFLENAHQYFVDGEYSKSNVLHSDIANFYSVFPKAESDSLDELWLGLAKECYSKVCKSYSNILAVVEPAEPHQREARNTVKLKVSWHPIKSAYPSSQVYFWSEAAEQNKHLQPIFEAIGMKITPAPCRIRKYINHEVFEDENKCPKITPTSVYDYYTEFSHQVISWQHPCAIESTDFKSVLNFKLFTLYTLLTSSSPGSEKFLFPKDPFGYPLLLTADGKLRKFDQNSKVILSEFVWLFPHSLDCFCHPDLVDVKYSETYFATENCEHDLIHKILCDNLPQCLCGAHKCNNARSILPIQRLQQLWNCFSLDTVFNSKLASILRNWALILTTDDHLYSSSCALHPILPLCDEDHENRNVFQLLHKIGMPIVDTSVVASTSATLCPNISEHTKVLNNLFHLNQSMDLSTKLSSDDISVLVVYLKSIHFRAEKLSCNQVKTLPLFEDVAGKFMSLSGLTVFIWPTYCSRKTGYSKWIRGYSTIIFLKPYASWSQLCSPSDLDVSEILTEDMYVKYIFPHFHLMSEPERYEHLKNMRDFLFDTNNFKLKQKHTSAVVKQRALLFVSALQMLECIGEDEHPLHRVSYYSDHEKEIFTTFSKHFVFLPKYFTSQPHETEQWMQFFRELGLKTTVTHDEFLMFCTETETGKNDEVRKASAVLINSLFSSEEHWYNHPGFLNKVSRISFVCCEKLHSLTWLAPAALTCRLQLSNHDCIDMTEPAKTAIIECSTNLWTVKPIATLPENGDILDKLSVCTKASTSNIIQNLKNICEGSNLTSINLFDKYPRHLRPPKNAHFLADIFMQHFSVLQVSVSDADVDSLKVLPCIPVHSSPGLLLKSEMVLVKPNSVVTCDVSDFHPFLHKLPDDFKLVTPLMESMGVKRELDLTHIQIVLDSAYRCADGKELDVNTIECVKKAITLMYKLLNSKDKSVDEDIKKQLSPLYLPSTSKTLVLSTKLVYHDAPYFRGKSLKFDETTQYTELDVSHHQYGFDRSQLCALLPHSIRPRGTSELCVAKVAPKCQQCDASELAKKVSTALSLSALPTAIVSIVKHSIPKDKRIKDELKCSIQTFLKDISIICYKDLKIVVLMKGTEVNVGKGKIPYFLDKSDNGHTLCLDIALKGLQTHHMYSEIAELVMSHLHEVCTFSVPATLKQTIELLLRAESSSELVKELETLGVPIDNVVANEHVKLSIGVEVPHEWHYRLDQDIDNLFHVNEYVGYEDQDGHFIVVRIVHAVACGELQNVHARNYLVLRSEDDEEGIEVSVLSLYKFMRGLRKVKLNERCPSVLPYEGTDNESATRSSYSDEDLYSVKQAIYKELTEIWKLDSENKRLALRRFYLQWHPDKNPDNPDFAEKVFRFLITQVDKLEQGLQLDDPDKKEATQLHYPGGKTRSWWWQEFRQWDHTATQHHWYHARDYEYEHSTPRGDGSHSAGYGWRHGSPFTAGDDNFRVPRQPDEGQRWFHQAAVDERALILFYNQMTSLQDGSIAGHVCFLSHQLAEKSLKAGMYAICGLDDKDLNNHVLSRHAYALQTEKPLETSNLAYHATRLETYYLDTRYPNRHSSPTIPASVYSVVTAEEAKEHATNIFAIVKSLLNFNSQ